MQIQRIQSLYLLIAAILMVVFCFIPFGTLTLPVTGDQVAEAIVELTPLTFVAVTLPVAAAIVLLLVDIFLFNNFARQKSVLIFAWLMILVSIGMVIYINCDHATQGTLHWSWGGILPVLALVASLLAMKGIRHDEQLLRSSNRLF